MLFDSQPKKNRPRCTKLDASGCCPKGVPKVSPRNALAEGSFLFLSMNRMDPLNGLVTYDVSLVTEIASLYGMDQQQRQELVAKTMYLVDTVNLSRLKAKDAEREAQEQAGKGGK